VNDDVKGGPIDADWRRTHAFGLPAGSIRALLALLIFGTTWALLVVRPGEEVPDFLRDLLFIILGHYFASRRAMPPGDEAGPAPLYLPRGSVRMLLVVGSLAVALVLLRRGQLTELERNPGAFTLVLVGGFLLGVILSAAFAWWKGRGHRTPRLVEDVRAFLSLVAAVLLVGLVLNHLVGAVPDDQIDALLARRIRLGHYGPEHVLAAIVGFYFGSRS
jgi:hypothetical protein